MNDIEQVAKALFEADEFSDMLYIYNKYGTKLNWNTAPASIQHKYIARAKEFIAEQDAA